MPTEAIKNIAEAEEKAGKMKADAAADAKKAIAEADKAGRELVDKARKRAEAENAARLGEAAEKAEKNAKEYLAKAGAEADALTERASRRVDEAAAMIAGRVVKGEWR